MGITDTTRHFPTLNINNSTIRTKRFYPVPNNDNELIRRGLRHKKMLNRRKKERNLQTIEDFLLLGENWNGNHAPPFNNVLIEATQDIIKNIREDQPDIFPTARESIQLEYEKENEDYLELEVFKDKIIVLMIINDEETEYDISLTDFQKINAIIGDFYERNH